MKLELIVEGMMAEAPIALESLTALHQMLKSNDPCPANLFRSFPARPGFDARMRAVIATALAIETQSYVSGIVRDVRVAEKHANFDSFDAVKFMWLAMANPLTMDSDTWEREFEHWLSKVNTRPGQANCALLSIVGSPWMSGTTPHPEELILKAAPKDVTVCYQDTHRFLSGRLLNAPRARLV